MRARWSWLLLAASLGCGGAPPVAEPRLSPVVEARRALSPPVLVDPMDLPTPISPAVRTGTLPNGLTYYVLEHKKPEQRAALWLAVNAGSVLEDDDQRGLAHFVEHMAFNGTRRFPKAAIVDFIERSGMRFGADVNAYTSFDETVYQLTVPTDDPAVTLKGLDVLRDWASDVTFEPVEVEKERGVVLEEWRLGRGASARVRDKLLPVLFQGSRYAERATIGLPETIRTAKPETLARFYRDWYRPELMAVIAVGDFDSAEVEDAIKSRFVDLAKPAKPRERAAVAVPHDQAPAIALVTDPEERLSSITVYDKIDRRPDASKRDYRRRIVERLYHAMLSQRLAELRDEQGSPIVSASSTTRSLVRGTDALVRSATAKEGRVEAAVGLLFREQSRVERYGFWPAELERAQRDALAHARRVAREHAKMPARMFAAEIGRNFFKQEAIPGPVVELAWTEELTPGVTLEELNHLAQTWGNGAGRVITISAPASAALPTEADVRVVVDAATRANPTRWPDPGPPKPLLAAAPAPGKVVESTHDPATDATVWTLSNGVRVIVKPTTFQNDTIAFEGWQPGGDSLVPDADYVHARFADAIVGRAGAGDFSARALSKAIAGTIASVTVTLGELGEHVRGTTSPEDLETAMQLAYLRLAHPRGSEGAFAIWKAQQLETVRHRDELPEQRLADEMAVVLHGGNLRRRPVSTEMLEQVELDKAFAIWKQRFADFGGFTFVFVGNVELATLQPLVETYLGSLPSKGRRETWKNIGIRYPKGKLTKTVVAGSENKARVLMSFAAPDRWSLELDRDARVLSMVLRIRLREVLREDMGGVYGVSVGASVSREPTQRRHLGVAFGCDPDNVDKFRDAVFAELAKLARDGASGDYLIKVTEQLRRQHELDVEDNRWWLGALRDAYYYGDDFAKANDVLAVIARVTTANIKASAAHFFDEKSYVVGVMTPAKVAPAKP